MAALGTRDGDSCFLRGGEAVISCSFRFFSLTNSAITSLISSWQSVETKKLSVIGVDEAFSAILIPANRSRPAAGRMESWSMQKMMRTEVMLSCPELLIELDRTITVCSKSMILVKLTAQFITTSALPRDIHPYLSLASYKCCSGSEETAGMASMFTVSISSSDSPWFFTAFILLFLGFSFTAS